MLTSSDPPRHQHIHNFRQDQASTCLNDATSLTTTTSTNSQSTHHGSTSGAEINISPQTRSSQIAARHPPNRTSLPRSQPLTQTTTSETTHMTLKTSAPRSTPLRPMATPTLICQTGTRKRSSEPSAQARTYLAAMQTRSAARRGLR